eukprot:762433-Hanusia_phi.AAC.26
MHAVEDVDPVLHVVFPDGQLVHPLIDISAKFMDSVVFLYKYTRLPDNRHRTVLYCPGHSNVPIDPQYPKLDLSYTLKPLPMYTWMSLSRVQQQSCLAQIVTDCISSGGSES